MMGFLGQALIHTVPFLVMLTFIVTIHELGHFLVARAFGVKIDRFSIGFGRALLSRVDRRGVEWRVGWIPLGGYVKFSGDLDASGVPDQAGLAELKSRVVAQHGAGAERDYFYFKPVWQRALIVAAGPMANFALALVLLTLVFSVVGEQIGAPRVAAVDPGGPAAEAGFQRLDLITAVNGRPVRDSNEVTQTIVLSANDAVHFTVERGGQTLELTATPLRRLENDPIAGRIWVARTGMTLSSLPQDIHYNRLNPIQAVGKGADTMVSVVSGTFRYIGRIFSGKESGDLLNGPLGIAKAAGGVTNQAMAYEAPPALLLLNLLLAYLQFAAIVSIGMGIVNLLPIPVLDGGHLVFYGYEAVARRPVPVRVQEVGYRVGLALLAGLMLFATWNDLQKLSLFKFLGGLA